METEKTITVTPADKFHCTCGGNFTDITLRPGEADKATALCDTCGLFWYIRRSLHDRETWERRKN